MMLFSYSQNELFPDKQPFWNLMAVLHGPRWPWDALLDICDHKFSVEAVWSVMLFEHIANTLFDPINTDDKV